MSEIGNGMGEPREPSASEAELCADLKPTGALERMMIQQMARAHDTTLACFDRAEAAPEPAAREVELRLAARFMALFMQQAGALNRRRTQARQAEEAVRRGAFDTEAAKTRAFTRDCARTEATVGETEGFLKHGGARFAEAREARVPDLPGDAPAPTPELAVGESRQQRRARERQERKARRRLAGAA